MSNATEVQKRPHGVGRDIINLVKEDVLEQNFVEPAGGLAHVEIWARSAALYIKDVMLRGSDARFEGNHSEWNAKLACGLTADLEARAQLGEAKYGERLRAHNGRDALLDAYQEALDLWVYLRQRREENEVSK